MAFPFTISSKITIQKKDHVHLTQSLLFYEIDQFMMPFEMISQLKNEQEIYYLKGGHIPFKKLHNIIRTVEFQLNDTESSVIITLKTDTILVFLLFFLPLFEHPFHFNNNLTTLNAIILLWICGYSFKYFTLIRLKRSLHQFLLKKY